MTLCVSAFCDNGTTLIVANDLMVSFGETMTHSPALMKGFAFNLSWFGTFAGEVTPFEPIINRFLKQIEGKPNSFGIITSEFEEAYRAERNAALSTRVTAKYGMALDELKKIGKRLPDHISEHIWSEIGAFDLGTDFLVGGRDEQNVHHLFCVVNPGCVEHYTGIGYAAIGIGAEDALKMFNFRGYNWGHLTTAQSVYAVLEAKTVGEGPYVGKETILIVLDYKAGRVLKVFLPLQSSPMRPLIRQGQRAETEALIQQLLEQATNWQPISTL